MAKTIALIEKGKNGTFGVFTPDLKHTIIGEGNTVSEAKKDFENSVKEMIDSYSGKNTPAELVNLKFVYKYDIASLFNRYDFINISKFAQAAKINPSLMRQYKAGQYISETQVSKIQNTFRELGKEMSETILV